MTSYPVNATTGLTMGSASTAAEALEIANAYGYAEKCSPMYQNGWTLDAVGATLGMHSNRAYVAWDIEWKARKR